MFSPRPETVPIRARTALKLLPVHGVTKPDQMKITCPFAREVAIEASLPSS